MPCAARSGPFPTCPSSSSPAAARIWTSSAASCWGDGFVTKPYHTAILLAQIAALLKRAYPHQPDPALTWRGATLHLDRSQLTYQEATADLTRNELKILAYLFRHAGTICARGDLVSYLWDNQVYVDDNALSVNIGRIREKLAGIGLTGFIQTKHRQGYLI